jgi:translation initiation factor IF-1
VYQKMPQQTTVRQARMIRAKCQTAIAAMRTVLKMYRGGGVRETLANAVEHLGHISAEMDQIDLSQEDRPRQKAANYTDEDGWSE